MNYPLPLFATVCSLWLLVAASSPAEELPAQEACVHPELGASWPGLMDKAMQRLEAGGGYACTGQALANFISAFRLDQGGTLIITPDKARPSFCSSAVYSALLIALHMWDAEHERPVLTGKAWQALLPGRKADGCGPWGYANANGPGMALLIHELQAGHNFTQWSQAQPGDIMKLWWTEAIGGRERGHITIYRSQTENSVTFWSSNQNNPDGTHGYGIKTVPKETVKHVLFTRITKPEAFLKAPAIGTNKWLGSLLKTDITPAEVHRRSGIPPSSTSTQP